MNNLKEFREKSGLSQKELCELTGLKQQAYSHYETGKRELPINISKIIARVFEINWWELYED